MKLRATGHVQNQYSLKHKHGRGQRVLGYVPYLQKVGNAITVERIFVELMSSFAKAVAINLNFTYAFLNYAL